MNCSITHSFQAFRRKLVAGQSAFLRQYLALLPHNFTIVVASIAYAAVIQDNGNTLDFNLGALSAALLF